MRVRVHVRARVCVCVCEGERRRETGNVGCSISVQMLPVVLKMEQFDSLTNGGSYCLCVYFTNNKREKEIHFM